MLKLAITTFAHLYFILLNIKNRYNITLFELAITTFDQQQSQYKEFLKRADGRTD